MEVSDHYQTPSELLAVSNQTLLNLRRCLKFSTRRYLPSQVSVVQNQPFKNSDGKIERFIDDYIIGRSREVGFHFLGYG